MKTIFLDSNILLHFKIFVDIDWIKVCEDKKCRIILAPIVIEELDKIKIGNDDKSKRARKVLSKIEDLLENQQNMIRENVEFLVLMHRPDEKIFESNHLDYRKQDDHLIGSIIQYQEQNQDEQVFLCSFDIGPRLRSQQFGIKIIKIPNEYLLPFKETESEKQIKELIRENTLLKSRIPKPILIFENEKDFVKIRVNDEKIERNQFIQLKMDALKKDYPYLEYKDNKTLSPFAPHAILNIISKDQIERYNSDIDAFYSSYISYLGDLYEYELKNHFSIRINMVLTNEGNTPAEEVDVNCHFPEGFDLIDEDDLEDPPDEPVPPSTPKSLLEGIGSFNIRPFIPDIGRPSIPNLNKPTIRKTNSYDVHYYRKYVKHLTLYPLDTLIAFYNDYDSFKNFSIEYTIMAGNIQEPVTGKLNIVFEK